MLDVMSGAYTRSSACRTILLTFKASPEMNLRYMERLQSHRERKDGNQRLARSCEVRATRSSICRPDSREARCPAAMVICLYHTRLDAPLAIRVGAAQIIVRSGKPTRSCRHGRMLCYSRSVIMHNASRVVEQNLASHHNGQDDIVDLECAPHTNGDTSGEQHAACRC